jgi:hypothetical protein
VPCSTSLLPPLACCGWPGVWRSAAQTPRQLAPLAGLARPPRTASRAPGPARRRPRPAAADGLALPPRPATACRCAHLGLLPRGHPRTGGPACRRALLPTTHAAERERECRGRTGEREEILREREDGSRA